MPFKKYKACRRGGEVGVGSGLLIFFRDILGLVFSWETITDGKLRSWPGLQPTFINMIQDVGSNPFLIQMIWIRAWTLPSSYDQDSTWAHSSPEDVGQALNPYYSSRCYLDQGLNQYLSRRSLLRQMISGSQLEPIVQLIWVRMVWNLHSYNNI